MNGLSSFAKLLAISLSGGDRPITRLARNSRGNTRPPGIYAKQDLRYGKRRRRAHRCG